MNRSILIAALLLFAAAGCLAYNECTPPTLIEPSFVETYFANIVDITEATVWAREAPFGDLVAEAYLDAFTEAAAQSEQAGGGFPWADVAVINAGSIRQEVPCSTQTRDDLPAGPLTRLSLREALPFDDTLVMVALPPAPGGGEPALKKVLEHAVAGLALPGRSVSGAFLQVAGMHFAVDCASDAEVLSPDNKKVVTPGARVTGIRLDATPSRPACTLWPPGTSDACPRTPIYLVTNSFIGSGGDHFVALRGLSPIPAPASLDLQNFQVVEEYLARQGATPGHPLELPLPEEQRRIVLSPNCQ